MWLYSDDMTTAATQSATPADPPAASRLIASEVRAEMGRQLVTRREMATRLGVSHTWVNRRVGPSADLEISFEEAERMAAALTVPVMQLLDTWIKATAERPAAPGGGQAFLPLDEAGAPSGTRTPNPLIPRQRTGSNVVPLRSVSSPHTRQEWPDTPRVDIGRPRHLRLVDEAAS